MKIGILEAGPTGAQIAAEYGTYAALYRRLLGAHDPALEFETWRVHDNVFPDGPEAADAWILSGSRYGVYDPEPFIPPLRDLIRGIVDARRPLVGICFGHQLMADTLGGTAEKWPDGWQVGTTRYDTLARPDWMGPLADGFSAIAVHQDQVTRQPPGTTLLARADGCPIAALAYGDPEDPYAISIQPHPEFTPDYVQALIDTRLGALEAVRPLVPEAEASLTRPVDNTAIGAAMLRILRRDPS